MADMCVYMNIYTHTLTHKHKNTHTLIYIYIFITLEQKIRDMMENSGTSSQNFLVIRPTAVSTVLYRANYILQRCSQNLCTIISR